MSDDLTTKVRKWLDGEGYPLEMTTGQLFSDQNWHVEYARWYKDPVSGAMREIDLVATRERHGNPTSSVSFSVVVECKSSRDKPWVALTAKHFRGFLVAPQPFPNGISGLATAGAPARRLRSLLPPAERSGHGIVMALRDSRAGDPTGPFAAIKGVVSAAEALDRDSGRASISLGDDISHLNVVSPLVVVDAHLFEFFVDPVAKMPRLAPVERVSLIYPCDEWRKLLVNVVRLSALAAFITSLTEEVDQFLTHLEGDVQGRPQLPTR